jgi:HipA-like protein
MIRKIKSLIWKTEGMEALSTPVDSQGNFILALGDFKIGILRYEKGVWYFEYTSEFISKKPFAPIRDFPDTQKKYQASELWPFFATRIPSLNQPFHLKKIEKANIDKNNEVSLLKVFGKDTITNPFQLFPAL